MKKSKYSDEQIATALRQVDAGAPVTEVTRKLGISEADLLYLAQEISSDGHRGNPAVTATGRRKPKAQATGGRLDAR